MNARSAVLDTIDWRMADYPPSSGHTVFSCFACGGGSTMGYKLAGFTVAGNCEIDPRINAIYVKNHHPKFNYCMDIRKLVETELPDELHSLDVLDGSPPCSVFSLAGDREKAWNKEKVFYEGQVKQRLDDLFAWYIKLGKKLQPKVIVAENVKGLIQGNAKGYVNEILRLLGDAGYKTQMFLLNAASMGVPQQRERVFFIAHRKDLRYPKLRLSFNEKPITFGEIRTERGVPPRPGPYAELIKQRQLTDKSIAHIYERVHGKWSGFNNRITSDNEVPGTLCVSGTVYRMCDGDTTSDTDVRRIATFPVDYDFDGVSNRFMCGMCVPPFMMRGIATEIKKQWLTDGKNSPAGKR